MKTEQKIRLLADLFMEANLTAALADPGADQDGGTCNMDSPAFRVKGTKQSTIEAAAKMAGLQVVDFTWFAGQKWYWLGVTLNGQGNRRAAMSTAAAHVLAGAEDAGIIPGFEACQYCQMD